MSAFKSAIKQTSVVKSSVKKSTMPVIEVKNSVANEIENFIKANKAEKLAKADKDFAGSNIIAHCRPIQDKRALAGDFVKSYTVKSDKGVVKFITADKFGVNTEDEETLKSLLDEHYDNLLEEKITVTLKAEVFQDEAKQEELMNLLGDKFAEFFDVETKLQAKEDFDKNVYKAVNNQNDLDELRLYAKQNKPSIRG